MTKYIQACFCVVNDMPPYIFTTAFLKTSTPMNQKQNSIFIYKLRDFANKLYRMPALEHLFTLLVVTLHMM